MRVRYPGRRIFAAADFGREEFLEAVEPDRTKLEGNHRVNFIGRKLRIGLDARLRAGRSAGPGRFRAVSGAGIVGGRLAGGGPDGEQEGPGHKNEGQGQRRQSEGLQYSHGGGSHEGGDEGREHGPGGCDPARRKDRAGQCDGDKVRYSKRTRERYERWRRSPQSRHFLASDWDRLIDLAPLWHALEMSPLDTRLTTEIRAAEKTLGATIEDRLRAHIKVTPAKPAEDAPQVAKPRERLRVVG